MRMMRCLVGMEVHVVGGDGAPIVLCPPLEVDFDRVLRHAKEAKGTEGQPDFQPAVPAYTLGEAVAGRENCFEAVVPPAPSVVPMNPRAAASADASQE